MTHTDLSVATARAALAGIVDDALGDDDVVVAYVRAQWSCLVEPGDGVAGALIAEVGPVRAFEIAIAEHGGEREAEAAGISPAELMSGRGRWHPRRGSHVHAWEAARRSHVTLLTPEDAAWPMRLDDLGRHAPLSLWVKGDVEMLGRTSPGVAIVGARAATAYGEYVAEDIAAGCAASGFTVFSGAAYGIDGAAHRGALAAGGATVAVLAGGADRLYPSGHRALLSHIGQVGAIVAELPCGTQPAKWRFLGRNRIIAALSDTTVVVEAGSRSGALNTAHHAADLGRPLGAVPGPVTSASSVGCHQLMREAGAECITGIEGVREMLGISIGMSGPLPPRSDSGSHIDDFTRIIDALSNRSARSVEDVARRAGFGVDAARSLLGLLELEDSAQRSDAGWVLTAAAQSRLW